MNHPPRDDTPRWKPPPEFLRELPDLISGKEPELLRPEAQAWLRRDPQAREYAQEICAAIAMFDGVPSRLTAPTREPISAHAKRSVQRAVRQLPQRLAEVLWPLLTIELDRVARARGGRFLIPSIEFGSFSGQSKQLLRSRDRLLEEFSTILGRPPSAQLLDSPQHLTHTSTDGGRRARNLMVAFHECLPTHSMNTWSSLLLDHYLGTTSTLDSWNSFLSSSRITAYHDYILYSGALANESARDFASAAELCDQLLLWYPESEASTAASYTNLKLSVVMGNRSRLQKQFRAFARALEARPSQKIFFQQQLLMDADEWKITLDSQPDLLSEILALVGNRS